MTSPTGRRRLATHRARWTSAAVVLVLVALGIGGFALWHRDSGPRVGDRIIGVTAYSNQFAEHERFVRVPFGTLALSVGSGSEAGLGDSSVTAPDGAGLVVVRWAPRYDGGVVWPRTTPQQRSDPQTRLTLVTGSHRYPVATGITAADENGMAIVVVDGDGKDARVEASFAGRSVRAAPGRGTFGPPQRVSQDCHSGDGTHSLLTCKVTVERADYVAGLGAAPAGKVWAVVDGSYVTFGSVAIHRHRGNGEATYRRSGRPRTTVTLNGSTRPDRIAGKDSVRGADVHLAARAWLIPADRAATVQVHYRLPSRLAEHDEDWKNPPTTHEVEATATVSIAPVKPAESG